MQPLDPAGISTSCSVCCGLIYSGNRISKTARKILEILCRILLPAVETSLTALKVFYDCSGGNSRPSRLSGVGGGNFLGHKRSPFFLARDVRLLIALNTKA